MSTKKTSVLARRNLTVKILVLLFRLTFKPELLNFGHNLGA